MSRKNRRGHQAADLSRRGRRHRRGRRAGRAHQAARAAHLPPRGHRRPRRLRRPVRGAEGLHRAGAGLGHRRRRHQAQGRLRHRAARHHRHRPRRHVRERHRRVGRRAALLPRLLRHRASSTSTSARRWSRGIAEGCRQAGCALIGGETAELPGMYADGEYDLAGFAVGVVERAKILDGKRIRARRRASSAWPRAGCTRTATRWRARVLTLPTDDADALLAPTRIYVRADPRGAARPATCKGLAHITGGGLVENPPRVLADGLVMRLDERSWPLPPIFGRIASVGRVARARCGAPSTAASASSRWCRRPTPRRCARRSRARRRARLRRRRDRRPAAAPARVEFVDVNVGVLVSGSGTNLQAILDAEQAGRARPGARSSWCSRTWPACARSSGPGAPAWRREVLPHKGFASRQAFDEALVGDAARGTASSWWRWPASCASSTPALPRRVSRARHQHPPGAAAGLSRRPRAAAGARLRRARHRLHRALRRRGHRHRADHRAGGGAGARRRRRGHARRRASSSRSTASTLPPSARVAEGRVRVRGATRYDRPMSDALGTLHARYELIHGGDTEALRAELRAPQGGRQDGRDRVGLPGRRALPLRRARQARRRRAGARRRRRRRDPAACAPRCWRSSACRGRPSRSAATASRPPTTAGAT